MKEMKIGLKDALYQDQMLKEGVLGVDGMILIHGEKHLMNT
jgi:hypothetical protein